MSTLRFEWDNRKAAANLKKHGVSFEEAKTVFFDERAKLIDDPDHSENEERFVLLGMSSTLQQHAASPARLPLLPEQRQCYPHNLRTQGDF